MRVNADTAGSKLRIGINNKCPPGEPKIGWSTTCETPYKEPPKEERIVGRRIHFWLLINSYSDKAKPLVLSMKDKKPLTQDQNYPENFWPKIIFYLSIGGFIYWVMTSPNADANLHKYLIDPIQNKLGYF